jgi:23S rRNA (adenine2503-C2)-methyltransferase
MEKRDWLVPVRKWSFERISEYGERFCDDNERKVTLNFALGEDMPVDPVVLRDNFNPEKFFIKITPINPTYQSVKHNISSRITPEEEDYQLLEDIREMGFEVLLSIGEWEENHIGSNCGQHITNYLNSEKKIKEGYNYSLKKV